MAKSIIDISHIIVEHITSKEAETLLKKRASNYELWPGRVIGLHHAFRTYYSLYCKGRNFEKNGDLERALDYYIYIRFIFNPEGTLYYDRPAIVFENLKRYRSALAVCQMHIKAAQHKDAHLDLHNSVRC